MEVRAALMTHVKKVVCPSCDGSGTSRCPKCNGTGYTGKELPARCTNCGRGDGLIECGRCNGKGVVDQ